MKNGRLLYIHTSPPTENKANVIQVLNMASALVNEFEEVCLMFPVYKKKPNLYKKYYLCASEILGYKPSFSIDVFKTNLIFKKRATALLPLVGIKKLLQKRRGNFDYVMSRSFLINHYAIKAGYKVIYESHNYRLSDYKILNFIYSTILIRDAKKKNQKLIITISNALAKFWEKEGVPNEIILPLHDGVSTRQIQDRISIKEARVKCNLEIGKKYVVYSGSLNKNRGIEIILKLAMELPSVIFLIVGGNSEHIQYYGKQLQKNNITNVIFKGYITHKYIKYYLASADVLLMIWSWKIRTMNYCSPMKLFEYMASGRIIVGHAFPTILEVLENNIDAFLVDPEDYDALKEALQKALTLSYPNRLVENALIKVEKYSWEKRVQQIKKFL